MDMASWRGLMAAGALAGAMAQGLPGTDARAQTDVRNAELLNACSRDLQTFCATVTPGGGRLLACIAAHEDQLSQGCLAELYDRTQQLSAFANTIAFVATACSAEIDAYCGGVEPGEGRMNQCLGDPSVQVTPQCQSALEGIGIRK